MPIDGQFILGAFLLVVVILVVLFVLVTLFRSIRIIKQGFTGVVGMEHGNSRPGREGERAVIDAYVAADGWA